MGEAMESGMVRDRWRIRRGGRLIHAEDLLMEGDMRRVTAAAPVLFPLVLTPAPDEPGRLIACTDGGLWANSPVLIALLEAMKMQNSYKASSNGTVKEILVQEGDTINSNQVLITLDLFKE